MLCSSSLLNVCAHVVDEVQPGPPHVKPSLPSLPNAPSLSPIKRKAKATGKEEAPSTSQVQGGAGQGAMAGATQAKNIVRGLLQPLRVLYSFSVHAISFLGE